MEERGSVYTHTHTHIHEIYINTYIGEREKKMAILSGPMLRLHGDRMFPRLTEKPMWIYIFKEYIRSLHMYPELRQTSWKHRQFQHRTRELAAGWPSEKLLKMSVIIVDHFSSFLLY
jgi:hypothetical protein